MHDLRLGYGISGPVIGEVAITPIGGGTRGA